MRITASLCQMRPRSLQPRPRAANPRSRALGGGLGLAHDGRHGGDHGRLVPHLGLGDGHTAVPRVPALPRIALLLGGHLGAVQVADEAGARAARPVRAAVHAAAHVQRAAGPGGPGRQPDDALGGDGGGQLPFRGQPLVALEDALLFRGRELFRVLAAEPAVARSGSWLTAARNGAQPSRPTAVDLHAAGGNACYRIFDLSLHQFADRRAQVLREPLDQRAERGIPVSLGHGHDCCVFLRRRNGTGSYLSGDAAKRERNFRRAPCQRPNTPLSLFAASCFALSACCCAFCSSCCCFCCATCCACSFFWSAGPPRTPEIRLEPAAFTIASTAPRTSRSAMLGLVAGPTRRSPTGTLVFSFTRPPVICCTVAGVSATVPGMSIVPSRRTPPEKLISACGVDALSGSFRRAHPSFSVRPTGRSLPKSVTPLCGNFPRRAPGSAPITGDAAEATMSLP